MRAGFCHNHGSACAAFLALLPACYSGGDLLVGLAASNAADTGPRIVWDPTATPFPDVPFPNDVGTRADLGSPTGLRLNVSTRATTRHEEKLRRLLDTLDGFSTYGPLSIHFDGRIDLVDLICRQETRAVADALQLGCTPPLAPDVTDDAVLVVNLNPASREYGQSVLLDFASGRFPRTLEDPRQYFVNDPHEDGSNLLFETTAEDQNANGRLDAGEDSDDDGVLDRPNTWGEVLGDPARNDPYRDLITFYELETNTLLARPVLPLEEHSTYAVIVTRRLRGIDDPSPVRSPFPIVNHVEQTAALRPLVEDGILNALGLSLDDVAFAWTFTTQSISGEVETLRAGLYGVGPLARLSEEFPARLSRVPKVDKPAHTSNLYVLTTERLVPILSNTTFVGSIGFDAGTIASTVQAYQDNVAYMVFPSFDSPAFIDNSEGVFHLDAEHGKAEYGRESIAMFCAVPRAERGSGPPFPVVFYSHGYTSMHFEALGFAGQLASFGLATCSIDAYGHGVPDSGIFRTFAALALAEEDLTELVPVLFDGRAQDLNGDGITDSGADFWTANIFHTRDVVRQTMIDTMQAVRVLRSFGRVSMPVDIDGDGVDELAGDFNADGIADLGGERPYFMMGQSLGGIMSAVVPPLEPSMLAAAPVSGGGGLTDLVLRSEQSGVVEAVFLPLFGPIISGRRAIGGVELIFVQLAINEDGHNRETHFRFARVPDNGVAAPDSLLAGDRVRVTNLDNGEFDEATVRDNNGTFRVQLPADYNPVDLGDRIRVELFRPGMARAYRVIERFEQPEPVLSESGYDGRIYAAGEPLRVLQEGFGVRRQTPAMRRLIQVAQTGIDRADPINHAGLFAEPPLTRPEGRVPTNLLVVNTIGDMNVPINSGVALARAARLFDVRYPDPAWGKSADQLLIDSGVIEGLEAPPRFVEDPCHYDARAVLFDIDEPAQGLDPLDGPRSSLVARPPACDGSAGQPAYCATVCAAQPPLRATRSMPWGRSGVRFLYGYPCDTARDPTCTANTGRHGFLLPDPAVSFDYNLYQINQIGRFFATAGAEIVDDTCLASSSCSFQ